MAVEVQEDPNIFPYFMPEETGRRAYQSGLRENNFSLPLRFDPIDGPGPYLSLDTLVQAASFSPFAALMLAKIYCEGRRKDVIRDKHEARNWLKFEPFLFPGESEEEEERIGRRFLFPWEQKLHANLKTYLLRENQTKNALQRFFEEDFSTRNYYFLHSCLNLTRIAVITILLTLPMLIFPPLARTIMGNLGIGFHGTGFLIEMIMAFKNGFSALSEKKRDPNLGLSLHGVAASSGSKTKLTPHPDLKTFEEAFMASFQKRGRVGRLRNFIIWGSILIISAALAPLLLNPVTMFPTLIVLNVLSLVGFAHDILLEGEALHYGKKALLEKKKFLEESLGVMKKELELLDTPHSYLASRIELGKEQIDPDLEKKYGHCYFYQEITYRLTQAGENIDLNPWREELLQEQTKAQQVLVDLPKEWEALHKRSTPLISIVVVVFIGAVLSTAAAFVFFCPTTHMILLGLGAFILALGCLAYMVGMIWNKGLGDWVKSKLCGGHQDPHYTVLGPEGTQPPETPSTSCWANFWSTCSPTSSHPPASTLTLTPT